MKKIIILRFGKIGDFISAYAASDYLKSYLFYNFSVTDFIFLKSKNIKGVNNSLDVIRNIEAKNFQSKIFFGDLFELKKVIKKHDINKIIFFSQSKSIVHKLLLSFLKFFFYKINVGFLNVSNNTSFYELNNFDKKINKFKENISNLTKLTIYISPFTSDGIKNLSNNSISDLVNKLKKINDSHNIFIVGEQNNFFGVTVIDKLDFAYQDKIIKNADYIISADSGQSHIAALLKKNTIIFYSCNNHDNRWLNLSDNIISIPIFNFNCENKDYCKKNGCLEMNSNILKIF